MSTFSSLDACVAHWMTEWTVPGMAIGILRNGRRELHGYGVTSIDTEYAVTPETLFQVGSISKIYTTTMVMKLVQDGVLELDAPVSRYLPELTLTTSGTQDEVTVRHLVTHTSGIFGDHFADFGWGDDALQLYCDSLAELPQIYAPGELWSYCNSGFDLAGRIIEVVTGRVYEDVMRTELFEPLGLDHTFFFAHEAITYPVAIGHVFENAKGVHEIARRYPIPRASNAAGAVIANVNDLLSFAEFHIAGTPEGVLDEGSRACMQQTEVDFGGLHDADGWGLGWQINVSGDTRVYSHGGATNGFNAHFDVVPAQGFAMASLTNSGRGAAAYREVVKWVLREYCGLAKPEPAPMEMGEAELSAFAGHYAQLAADIHISVAGGQLKFDVERKSLLADDPDDRRDPPVHAAPLGGDLFVVADGAGVGGKLAFIRGADEAIRFVRYGGRLAARQ